MALRPMNSDGIPKGAVKCSYEDAILYQWGVIRNWPHLSDVWPFRIGLPMLTSVAAWTGWKINSMFRRKLKLHSYGLGATQLAMTLTPALLAASSHVYFITHDVFFEQTKCELCLQQRAICLQLGFGIAYPLVMSPIANFMYSARHGTYNLPYWADYKGTYKLWIKFMKPMKSTLITMFILQTCLVAGLTHLEKKSLAKVQDELSKEELLIDPESPETKQKIFL